MELGSLKYRFSAALLSIGAMGGCVRSGGIVDFQELPQSQKTQGGEYAIRFVSAKIIDMPWPLPDGVHNSLKFLNTKTGEKIGTLDGVALDRTTGEVANIGNGGNYLYVSKNYRGLDGADMMVTEIFSGSYEDVVRYYLIALDAAYFINQQNLRYQLMGVFEEGQNSNSVARTIAEEALGFEAPERHSIFVTPGNDRSLLPKGWKSFYADWTPPSNDPVFLQDYVRQVQNKAHIINYETPPHPARPFFFMPEAPFVKYQPLVIPEALKKWQKTINKPVITAAPTNLLATPVP